MLPGHTHLCPTHQYGTPTASVSSKSHVATVLQPITGCIANTRHVSLESIARSELRVPELLSLRGSMRVSEGDEPDLAVEQSSTGQL